MRETALPGAVLTRVAASHIRVGTFQFFAARGDIEALRLLADHVIARHYPELRRERPYRALLEGVIARQAELVARWLLVGFIHGVMNTDNISISGETIDYGPCAFMDAYDPATVFSSIDEHGPLRLRPTSRASRSGTWRGSPNACCRCSPTTRRRRVAAGAGHCSAPSPRTFRRGLSAGLRTKLGLFTEREGDEALAQDLLDAMAQGPGRLHPDLPPARRRRAAIPATTTCARAVRGTRRVR